MTRSAGILMPVSSLPGPYGIGSFGKEAYDFVDFLEKSGQTYWPIHIFTENNKKSALIRERKFYFYLGLLRDLFFLCIGMATIK